MIQQPHKTSVTLDAPVYVMLQSIMAQRKDLTMAEAINTAIRFYYDHADDPTLDALTAQLTTLLKHLETLLTQQTQTLDLNVDHLAAQIITHLDALRPPPPPVPPPPVAPSPPAVLTTDLTPLRWSERFARRFRRPDPEHW